MMSDDEEYLDTDKRWKQNSDGEKEFPIQQNELEDNTLIFNPYNPKNKEIPREEVIRILKDYGLPDICHNLKLYRRAFVHRSYIRRPDYDNLQRKIKIEERDEDCLPLKSKSNERLEFLGDGVLECIVKYYLYRRFPKASEGFMTEKKIMLVRNETIGRFAYELGLHKYFIISRNAEEKGIRTHLKKLGCLFEAFVGAIFLDFNKVSINDDWFKYTFMVGPGLQMAQLFIENVLERHVDWNALIHKDDNYKNILQVKVQKQFKQTPYYVEWGYDPEEGYDIGVYIAFNIEHSSEIKSNKNIIDYTKCDINFNSMSEEYIYELSRKRHKIKKKAEQDACKDVINRITPLEI